MVVFLFVVVVVAMQSAVAAFIYLFFFFLLSSVARSSEMYCNFPGFNIVRSMQFGELYAAQMHFSIVRARK